MKLICPNKSFFSNEIINNLKFFFKCTFVNITQKKFDKIVHDFDIVLLRFTHNLKFKKNSKIKYIISPTTGLNHIDDKFFRSKIKIISLKNEFKFLSKVNSTIEHTFFLLFNILRKYPRNGEFGPKKNYVNWISEELYNKTVGIVGYGRIGKKVYRISRSFGAKPIFYDTKSYPNKKKLSYLLKTSDIISFHINYTKKNHGKFNFKILKNVKEKAIIINTSRGEIFNQNDLLKVLYNKKLSFAFDVLSNENNQLKTKNFIVQLQKLKIKYYFTPHVAGLSKESIYKTDQFIYEKFLKIFNG